MLRKLVTLIALLTGLAALAGPVEARVPAVAAVGLEASGAIAAQTAAARISRGAIPIEAIAGYKAQSKSKARPKTVIYFPTVQLGIDRARE